MPRLVKRFTLGSLPSPLLRPVFPAEARMVTLDRAGNLTLWDTQTWRPLTQTRCEASPHHSVQGWGLEASPDRLLAVYCAAGLFLYDALSLEPHSRRYARPNTRLGFMAGGKWLAMAESDLSVIDTATQGTVLRVPPRWGTEFCNYTHLAADPMGQTVLFVDDGGYEDIGLVTEGPLNRRELTLLEVSGDQVLHSTEFEKGGGVVGLSFDPWRGRYWVLTHGGKLEWWDRAGTVLGRGSLPGRLLGVAHSQRLSAVLRSDGSRTLTTVVLWENDRPEPPDERGLEAGRASWVALSPDGNWLLLPQGNGFEGYAVAGG